MKIKTRDSQRKIPINKREITYLAKQTLKIKDIREGELSILFVGKSRIRALNKKFRKIDRPTDVLAFSMREGKGSWLHPEILGDVVICPEITQKFSKIYKTSLRQEIHLCLIHGILHLLGYNDTNAKKRSLMEKEQERILHKLKKQKFRRTI